MMSPPATGTPCHPPKWNGSLISACPYATPSLPTNVGVSCRAAAVSSGRRRSQELRPIGPQPSPEALARRISHSPPWSAPLLGVVLQPYTLRIAFRRGQYCEFPTDQLPRNIWIF